MKKLTGFSVLLFPVIAIAQNYDGMDEAQMQRMMQKAQEMQTCMANVDPAEMEAFQQKAAQMQSEVDALCAAGKRDEAMSRAMSFGHESASNKAMQAMKKCGEGMQHGLPKVAVAGSDTPGAHTRHICDVQ